MHCRGNIRKLSFDHKRRRRLLSILCLAVMLFSLPAAAAAKTGTGSKTVDPVGQSENYSAILYDNTNGLPTSESNAIAQTEEGFLWIGSYSGLIRYDGNTFERMDSTTGVSSVVSLHVDSRDRLWIGTNESGLALMEQGELRMWDMEDGLGADKVTCIEEGPDGTIYAGTTAGIMMITPDLDLTPIEDMRAAGAYIETMTPGEDGHICCMTNEDDIIILENGRLAEYIGHNDTAVQGITSILPDPASPGAVYLGTEGSFLYHGSPRQGAQALESVDISPLFSVSEIRQIGDSIWICARNGIGVVDSGGFHHLSELPMNNSISHVMEDYEGNLWFTSSRQGVMKLVSNPFSDIFTRYDLPPSVVNSTCMYRGDLYMGTDTGLLVLDEKGQIEKIPLEEAKTVSGEDLEAGDLLGLLEGNRIRSVIRDSKDRLWISTWRGVGLLCYDGKSVTAFTEAEGLLSDHIRQIHEMTDGSFLVACTGGVNLIRDGKVTAAWGKEDGIANPETLTACEGENGDILVGSNGGGIYIIGKEGVRCIGKKEGLPSGIVMRIRKDPVREVYWIVTGNAIAFMTKDYQVTTIRKFPYSNNFDVYWNSLGDLWILSSNGIYVVPAEELLANGQISPVHYSRANGLPCIATSNSFCEVTKEGDLYIAGNTGVARVNIESSLEDIVDLKQAVPYVDADGVFIYPDADNGFTIPAKTRRLTIYSFVFNYSLTDPQVSCHLEGFDQEAVTVSRSDLGPVTYTNLRGGSYQFVMELKDAMGRGSKTLTVPIVKEKALFEETWFYVLIALLSILVIHLLVRLYVNRKTQTLEIRHRNEMEKERLNTELQTARDIQESMLPHDFPPFPDRNEFRIYASMDPALQVGGDFYDFFLIDEDHLCMVIADVSGKGIPAALFMMASKIILQNNARMGRSAAEVLTRTNEAICSNNQADMFVTVWLGILEISTGRVTAANAGHEYPAIMKNGTFGLMKDRHGLVIGGMEGIVYREYDFVLEPGDKLFVYTDGVPEATAADSQMFGTDRMLEALNQDPPAEPEQVLRNVRRAVDGFVMDAEQFDDLTMLCLEYLERGEN